MAEVVEVAGGSLCRRGPRLAVGAAAPAAPAAQEEPAYMAELQQLNQLEEQGSSAKKSTPQKAADSWPLGQP